MAFWIEHPPKPNELILVWQEPPASDDRLRWAVGRLWMTGHGPAFDYLKGDEFRVMNLGRTEFELSAAGFSGYPAFDRKRRPPNGFEENVLQAFLRRVPSAKRADFNNYLAHYHVSPGTSLSPFDLLAVTEAHLPSDGFSLIDPLDPSTSEAEFVFEIAGFRHKRDAGVAVEIAMPLDLRPEPANQWDPMAVQVFAGDRCIGYVNRLQARTIRVWLHTRQIECLIARLNGKPEAPRAYALMKVRPLKTAAAA